MDLLEPRRHLSAVAVTFYGSAGDDKVLIAERGHTIRVVVNKALTVLDARQVSAIHLYLLAGNDELNATNFVALKTPLYVDGGAGDDVIRGSMANDTLIGGPGRDYLHDLRGDDIVNGGDGDDWIFNYFNDTIFGRRGMNEYAAQLPAGDVDHDSYFGGAGNDVINAGSYSITRAFGENGNDAIELMRTGSLASGGDGNDLLQIENRFQVALLGGNRVSTLMGGAGMDRLLGSSGRESMTGGLGRDTLDGRAGDDTLWGGEGDDRIIGGAGRDEIHGSSGNDLIDARDNTIDLIDGGSNDDAAIVDRTTHLDVLASIEDVRG